MGSQILNEFRYLNNILIKCLRVIPSEINNQPRTLTQILLKLTQNVYLI